MRTYFPGRQHGQRAQRARTPNEGFIQAMGQPQKTPHGAPPTGDAGKTLIEIEPVAVVDTTAELLGRAKPRAPRARAGRTPITTTTTAAVAMSTTPL